MATLTEVFKLLSTEPLTGEGLKNYVNLKEGRGDNPIASIKRHLLNNKHGKMQMLFSGYRGCGKSTELNKLQFELTEKNDFIILNYSVQKELDIVNINYTDLFIVTMEKLFEEAVKNDIPISHELLDSVLAWTNTVTDEQIKSYGGDIKVEAGMEAKAKIPLFLNFFAKLRASGNASYSSKQTISRTIEHRLSDLITQCNDLITEIKLNIGERGLLIIIEDLDKLSLEKAEELYLKHSHTLIQLKTNVIFTYPLFLRFHPQATVIQSNFDSFELPMVKVRNRDGQENEIGKSSFIEIINKRIGLECFEGEGLLEKFVLASGGCLRDLFRMIRNAADNALDDVRETITTSDFEISFNKLKREYNDSIAEKPGGVKVEEYFDILKVAATSPTKQINNSAAAMDLRYNQCLLSYNGEGWCDVHPVVRQILKDRELIQA